LRMENAGPVWQFDRFDPEESFIVNRIRRIYILMDKNGNILQRSTVYEDGTLPTPDLAQVRGLLASEQPAVRVVKGSDGVTYMLRDGVVPEERRAGAPDPHRDYFVSIGRPLNDNAK